MNDELLEDFESGILTLTINRPSEHNTMSASLSEAFMNALQRSGAKPDIRCIVITSKGNIFSAGGDVSDQASGALIDKDADPETARVTLKKTIRDGMEVFAQLHRITKPTLAVIPGAAAGAGLALALACDFRFCLDTAKLTTAFAKVGLSCDSGLSYFLPRIVGSTKARELCFLSDVITGHEAFDIGLVTMIAPKETFEVEARNFALRLAGLPTVAIGYMKEALNSSEHCSLDEILDLEADSIVRAMSTIDHKNAAKAFVNKERVTFEGH